MSTDLNRAIRLIVIDSDDRTRQSIKSQVDGQGVDVGHHGIRLGGQLLSAGLEQGQGFARIAGGTSTCEQRIEKFSRPKRRACQTAMALAGAVVSKPTAKNTTCRSACVCASFTASSGE